MTDKTIEPTHKLIDKYIPWFFVLFFLVLSCLMGWFAWLANSTERGVVSTRAYQHGIAYNHILEKQRTQDALGWTSELSINKSAGNPVHAEFVLKDKQHAAIKGVQVQLTLIRPTQAGHDVTLMLTDKGQGRYIGEAPLPLIGLWEAHIAVKSGEISYQTSKRVTLP